MIRIVEGAEFRNQFKRRAETLGQAIEVVRPILDAVQTRGDAAVLDYAKRFDSHDRESMIVDSAELERAESNLDVSLQKAFKVAIENVTEFAKRQMPQQFMGELAPGHGAGQIVRPLQSVAAYIPGGRYPLPSTVFMTCVPAKVAGVPEVWVTTPRANDTVLGAAKMARADRVALIGGAHAVAAFAFGTETIPKVDRIVGPGNIYVAAAKKLLAGEVGIDFVAGPTEVLILANDGDPRWIAADLLAQAEHDVDACAYLVTTSRALAESVVEEAKRQVATLPTQATARESLTRNGFVVVCHSTDEAVDLANVVCAEHLCLYDPELLERVQNAGSVFLGPYSPEAAGDYVTGPNHVLPTSGAARHTGGLSVNHFLKVITVQQLTLSALQGLSAPATVMARAEGLEAHARSIEVRTHG